MKVIQTNETQPNRPFIMAEQPLPEITSDEVLIKVHTFGLNRADLFQRKGQYRPPAGASPILGLEVAGEIVQCGAQVMSFKIGDKVCALLEGGGYAEYIKVVSTQLLPIPYSLENWTHAAALPEVCATVWYNVFMKAQVQAGQTVLIHGGTSGIGTMAIQLLKAHGIKIIVTAGTEEKCQFAENLGADKAINYKQKDFVEETLDYTQNQGIDVILDSIGGDYLNKNISLLKSYGKLVCIAFLKGAKTEVNMGPVLTKNLTIMGSSLRYQPVSTKAFIINQLVSQVWPLIEQGQVKPVIDRVFEAREVEFAHEYMLKSAHKGKIILRW